MRDVTELSRAFGVNAEWGEGGKFPRFFEHVCGKRILVLADPNTRPLGEELICALAANGCSVGELVYPESEPVADERTVERAVRRAEGSDYLLAVGAGTLNDIAKYAGFLLKKPSGVFATAPSMDGYTSGVTPLIEGGAKVTRPAQVASDVLMDADVLAAAPSLMRGAGVGDVLAKHCALADWRISVSITGEGYNAEAAALMQEAVTRCEVAVPALAAGRREGVGPLMDALLVSGYAMVMAGNSRPASGAEHHMSHFLEMDYLRRGLPIPLHGVKVGLGTLVSLYLYRRACTLPRLEGYECVRREAERLPTVEHAEGILRSLSCPVRFSEIGISEEAMREMLRRAYLIRDRFTILALYCSVGAIEEVMDEVVERFY